MSGLQKSSASSGAKSSNSNVSSRLCNFYKNGSCNNAKCSYAHKDCRHFHDCKNSDCLFGHSQQRCANLGTMFGATAGDVPISPMKSSGNNVHELTPNMKYSKSPTNQHGSPFGHQISPMMKSLNSSHKSDEDLSMGGVNLSFKQMDNVQKSNDKVRNNHMDLIDQLKDNEAKLLNQLYGCLVHEIESKREEISAVQHQITIAENQFHIYDEAVNHIHSLQSKEERLHRERRRLQGRLPFYAYRCEVINNVQNHNVSIIIGETGSGKSTQIASLILDAQHGGGDNFIGDGKIVVTQPRNLAALELAKRVAEEWGGSHGTTVVGTATSNKIQFCTDERLLNTIRDNPTLEGYACIVVDEVHERSVNTDLLLGLLKLVLTRRPTLRVVLTSATIDETVFQAFFSTVCYKLERNVSSTEEGPSDRICGRADVSVVRIPGRTFPVEDIYEEGEAESDYTTAAWKKALSIVKDTKTHGDILVFLPTVGDIDMACKSVKQHLGNLIDRVQVLPLHGKLQPEESALVFQPPRQNIRKIVFSTSIAETSVTIDGIVHVIDTGMANVAMYDQVRNMTSLNVSWICQSSVKQRRGRAGRTRPGVCHHLYSYEQYEELELTQVPEIQRSNLSMALLKLFELCGQNGCRISEFDFIDRPDIAALHEGVRSLYDLNAVIPTVSTNVGPTVANTVSNARKPRKIGMQDVIVGNDCSDNSGAAIDASTSMQLTPLGKQLLALRMSPEVGCMLLHGVKLGITRAVVTLSSILEAGAYVFYHGGDANAKEISKMHKATFCYEDDSGNFNGDWFTMLKVYQEWITNKKSKVWCREHSVVWKTLNMACHASVKTSKTLLKMGLISTDVASMFEREFTLSHIRIDDDTAAVESDRKLSHDTAQLGISDPLLEFNIAHLEEAICVGFFKNVCIANGSINAGYKVARISDRNVMIHPSSVLSLMKTSPKCLIYHELTKTSRFFISGLTAIHESTLVRVASKFAEHIGWNNQINQVYESFEFSNIGPCMCRKIIGKRGVNLQQLETRMKGSVEVDIGKSTVRVWTSRDNLVEAKSYFESYLTQTRNMLRMETIEVPVFNSDTRAVIGAGGETKQLLLRGEYRKVILRGFPVSFDWNTGAGIIAETSNIPVDAITEISLISVSSDGHSSWGYVICSLPIYCASIVDMMHHMLYMGCTIMAQACGERDEGQSVLEDTSIKVNWNCYPSKGIGAILFKEIGYAMLAADKLRRQPLLLGGSRLISDYSKNENHPNENRRKQIDISWIPSQISDDQLRTCVNARMDIQGVTKVYITRAIPKESSDLAFDTTIFRSLWTTCGEVESCITFPPDVKTGKAKAYVKFTSPESVLKAIQSRNGEKVTFESGIESVLEVKPDLSCSYAISSDMFTKLKDLLIEEKNRIAESNIPVVISGPIEKGLKGATIKIEGPSHAVISLAKIKFDEILQGKCLSGVDDVSNMSFLLNEKGKSFLERLQSNSPVYISWSRARGLVRLFGHETACADANAQILEFIEARKRDYSNTISLNGKSIRALLGKHGKVLASIEEESNVQSIVLDWRRHSVTVTGSEDSVNEAISLINTQLMTQNQTHESKADEILCAICADSANYSLQICGHKFCQGCLSMIIRMNSKPDIELSFPMKCPHVDCKEPFALGDIFSCSDPSTLQDLCNQSALKYVMQHGSEFCYCPGNDCNQILAKRDGFVACSKCCNRYCMTCRTTDGSEGVAWHEGMTCAQYMSYQTDGGDSLLQQYHNSLIANANGRSCPKCKVFIEKNQGCAHMTCICKHEFCFVCGVPSRRSVCPGVGISH